LIELGVVEVNTEPLDAGIERRLKEFWHVHDAVTRAP
jgi:hypothetical protein